MRDKADYARKGIARGRSCVALQYAGGILLVAPNPSSALHKISEIYDRIAFAAVGRYNEFENLRVAGVRLASGASVTFFGGVDTSADNVVVTVAVTYEPAGTAAGTSWSIGVRPPGPAGMVAVPIRVWPSRAPLVLEKNWTV